MVEQSEDLELTWGRFLRVLWGALWRWILAVLATAAVAVALARWFAGPKGDAWDNQRLSLLLTVIDAGLFIWALRASLRKRRKAFRVVILRGLKP